MTELSDLYSIASAVDRGLLDYNVKNLRDIRDDITISINLPKIEVLNINAEIYEAKNHTRLGCEDCDELEMWINRIHFIITTKEDEKEE